MNILITGCSGFLGSSLVEYFNHKYNIIATNRSTLDPRNINDVNSFFTNNKIDIVIHTAIKGGKRGEQEDIDTFFDNIKMFENLSSQSHKFKLMINFGSGAEFDRTTNIYLAKEEDIYKFTPKDYYGLSKNLITRKILNCDNIINLRIFGCFGPTEQEQRLLKNSLINFINNKNAIIYEDKYMDYFYIDDCMRVVEYMIENYQNLEYKDYNLCYNKKYKLSELVSILKEKINSKNNIDIIKKSSILNYCGDSTRIQNLNLDFLTVENAIEKMIIDFYKDKK